MQFKRVGNTDSDDKDTLHAVVTVFNSRVYMNETVNEHHSDVIHYAICILRFTLSRKMVAFLYNMPYRAYCAHARILFF